MQGHGRYSVTRRLLAATLSLVLVFASMIGAHAHAAHDAQQHDHSMHVVIDDVHAPAIGADNDHAEDGLNTAAKHATCGDLLCHGGFAILTGQADREHLHKRSLAVIARDDTKTGSNQNSLDRPPRVLALV